MANVEQRAILINALAGQRGHERPLLSQGIALASSGVPKSAAATKVTVERN
jgi:hypothetical protein